MNHIIAEKIVFTSASRQDSLYLASNGLHVQDVVIDAGIGQEIRIGHLSDIHYNYCNLKDGHIISSLIRW